MNNDLEHIIKRIACHDDEAAFRKFFDFYVDQLLTFSNSFLHRRELAEEVVEDVFIRIWQNRASLLSIDNIQFYLYRAVRNTTLNYLIRNKRQSYLNLEEVNIELIVTNNNPEEIYISKEIIRQIQQLIDALPPRCKMIFLLVKEQKFKYQQVAELLNISVKTVETQMSIALIRISTGCPILLGNKQPGKK
jgi:RNA polymerase sigma-70 factor (ECF subfamily)